MKKSKIFIFLLLSFIVLSGAKKAVMFPEKTSSLEIKGYVFDDKDKKIENAFIKLYQSNKVVQMTTSKKGGKFQFILFSGLEYMVEVNLPGYITERIQISTKEKTEFNGKYLYEFRVDLMKEADFKGVDISNLDFPTAIIKYDAEEGEYMHDEAYTKFVRGEMKKLKEQAKKK